MNKTNFDRALRAMRTGKIVKASDGHEYKVVNYKWAGETILYAKPDEWCVCGLSWNDLRSMEWVVE